MRTKTLALAAAIGAVSLATSMAQVYSVNIVGYINLPIAHGWNLIGNQLQNSAGDTVDVVIPNPPEFIAVYTYNAAAQSYNNANWIGGEYDDPSITIKPGDGAFVYNPGNAFNVTLVGEVKTGTQTIPMHNGWQLITPIVPQRGLLSTDLGFTPSLADAIYTYTSTYFNYNYLGAEWDEEPIIEVGQGMFVFRKNAGSDWSRTFNVN